METLKQLFITDLSKLVGRTIKWSARNIDDEELTSGVAFIKAFDEQKGIKIETELGSDLTISEMNGQVVREDLLMGDGFVYYEIVESDAERIGRMIKEVRLKQNAFLRDLESECGTTRSSISKIERGSHNATISVISRVLRSLGYRLTVERIPIDERWTPCGVESLLDDPSIIE